MRIPGEKELKTFPTTRKKIERQMKIDEKKKENLPFILQKFSYLHVF